MHHWCMHFHFAKVQKSVDVPCVSCDFSSDAHWTLKQTGIALKELIFVTSSVSYMYLSFYIHVAVQSATEDDAFPFTTSHIIVTG